MGKGTFSCVKWLLTIFNFAFLLCGLVICAIAVWIIVSPDFIRASIGKNLSPVISYILLGIGGMVILISFCGCVGSGLENRCLLGVFFITLCAIFVACLIASILVSIYKSEVSNITSDKLLDNLKQNYNANNAWTEFWDMVQTRLSCCGVSGQSAKSVYFEIKSYLNSKVPHSCCKKGNDGLFVESKCQNGDSEYIHSKGCMVRSMEVVRGQYIVMVLVLVWVTLMLVGGMVLSLVHLRNLNHVRRHAEYSRPL